MVANTRSFLKRIEALEQAYAPVRNEDKLLILRISYANYPQPVTGYILKEWELDGLETRFDRQTDETDEQIYERMKSAMRSKMGSAKEIRGGETYSD